MKLHPVSSCHNLASRTMPVRLGALALAVLFTATQMPAQGAAATTPQATTQQNMNDQASTAQAPAANSATAAAPETAPTAVAKSELSTLPEAPQAQSETGESASLSMSADMKAMMDEASQESENLQSTPKTTKNKVVQRPGMLVLGIAGVPLIILGTMIFSLNVGGKETGLRNGLGTAFLAPGAAMSGIGFYFAFHKKNQ